MDGLPGLLSVAIRGRQGIGTHWAELAEPLLSGEIGAIIGLLAIIPPPAHRYLHTRLAREIACTAVNRPVRAGLRPTAQRWHARPGAATRHRQPAGAPIRGLACAYVR